MRALNIHEKLQKELKNELTTYDGNGHIYVLLDPSRPHLRKIGMSTDTFERIKAINSNCGIAVELRHVRATSNHKRVESLIKHDLSNLCQPYQCAECGQRHKEWFIMDDEFATTIVNKWVDFMRQEQPYDETLRTLKPFWGHLLDTREPLFKTQDLDIDTLRMQWSDMLSPPLIVRLECSMSTLLAHGIWKLVWRFWWQLNAAGAWTIAYFAFQNRAVFLFMLSAILGTFISIAKEASWPTPRPRQSTAKRNSGTSPRKTRSPYRVHIEAVVDGDGRTGFTASADTEE